MNKRLITHFLLALSITVPVQLYSNKLLASPEVKPIEYISANEDAQMIEEGILLAQQQNGFNQVEAAPVVVAVNQEVTTATFVSRGGTGLSTTQASTTQKKVETKQPATNKASSSSTVEKKQTTYSSNVELLDWWKSAQYVFSVGTVAEVKDVYTGKTFMVKRTTGTNHADSEALTKKDTDIIKSIWGGFSWDRRPVIVTINGRRLAASMSAMPHAGLDSAPAYAVVDNRSDGYGRGDNLDMIKGNGMDGHFDIHFLNSTRHKDGQVDPQHQAAILKAAGK